MLYYFKLERPAFCVPKQNAGVAWSVNNELRVGIGKATGTGRNLRR